MKRIAIFVLLLGLTGLVGCEQKKPEKIQTNAPPAEPSADQTMPPADEKPAEGDKPAEGAAPADKPADETK